MSKAQEQADLLRAEANRLITRLLGIESGESNGQAERLVDCIISAAMLEAVLNGLPVPQQTEVPYSVERMEAAFPQG